MLVPSHPYLRFIPARIGNSPILDHAVKCVFPVHQARLQEQWQAYSRALHSLHKALGNQKTLKEPETLAAMLVLQMYENHSAPPGQASIVHARGLSHAIQWNGPLGFVDDFNRVILNAEIGSIVMRAVAEGEHCFLARPEWIRILKLGVPKDSCLQLMQNMALWAAPFPGLLKQFHDIRAIRTGPTLDFAFRSNNSADTMANEAGLISDLKQFQAAMDAWTNTTSQEYKDYIDAEVVHPARSLPPNASVLRCVIFASRVAASTFVVLSHYMIDWLSKDLAMRPRPSRSNVQGVRLSADTAHECQHWATAAHLDLVKLRALNSRDADTVANSMQLIFQKVLVSNLCGLSFLSIDSG